MGKKRGYIGVAFIFLLVLSLFVNFVHSDEDLGAVSSNAGEEDLEVTQEDLAFQCLSSQLGANCSNAKTVQDLAFSILASVNVSNDCVNKLLEKKSGDCFGDRGCGVKETAWAILALDHVKLNVTSYLDWLANQSKTSSGVEWFLQQDSEGDTDCVLKYRGSDYKFVAGTNKKLGGNIGSCFSFTQSNYWLKINENCIGEEFTLSCTKKYSVALHYKSPGSQVLNLLSDSVEKAANDAEKFSIESKCFGAGDYCNFEDTIWASIALNKKQRDIKDYVPYLISSEDSNSMYFPSAMNYLLDGSSFYGDRIVKEQKTAGYWESPGSVYGKYYDTALALLGLSNQNNDQVKLAKNWVWNIAQESSGCWGSNNIRDTALLLWALRIRDPIIFPLGGETPSVIQCPSTNVCVSSSISCKAGGGDVLDNFYCGGVQVCCSEDPNPREKCIDLNGTVCPSGKTCSALAIDSLDGSCCRGECREISTDTDTCIDNGGTCRAVCTSSERGISEVCSDSNKVCCEYVGSSEEENSKIPLWVWLLIGILLILIILAIIFRDRIKVWLHKNKKKKDEPSKEGMGSGPPRPGFPPSGGFGQPRPAQGFPQQRPVQPRPPLNGPSGRPPQQNDAFARLKEMTK